MMRSTATEVYPAVVLQLWAILLGRDHLRAFAQRVEVAEGEVRIMRSKSRLFQTLIANGGANAAPTQGLTWRTGWDSNPRWAHTHGGFQDRCLKPLGHPSRRGTRPRASGRRCLTG